MEVWAILEGKYTAAAKHTSTYGQQHYSCQSPQGKSALTSGIQGMTPCLVKWQRCIL